MGIVTVRADFRILIACRKFTLMDTVQCLCILLGMALLAGGIELQRKIARAAGYHLGMWETRDVRMTINTTDTLLPMDRGFEGLRIDRDWKRLSPDLSGHARLLMTSQTRFICGLLSLGWRRCFCRRCREDHNYQEKKNSQYQAG
jgi:hypothetical protein